MSINDGLKKLIELLKIEKEEDLIQYKLKMSDTSLNERRRKGVCWYPVIVDNTRYNAGERLIITVNRPEKYRENHLFSSGKLVSVFNAEGEATNSVNGVVNHTGIDKMIITLNSDNQPGWLKNGKLGVQLLFDESSYKEMNKALKKLIKSDDFEEIKKVLLGAQTPEFSDNEINTIRSLNQSQNNALDKVLNAKSLAVIHGPPGTGKTTTLVESIIETLKNEKQVLVCAPSNNAVDLLVEKLSERDVKVLRVGHPARVTEEMLGLTLDAKVANHEDYKDLKALRKEAEEYFSLAKKYKHSYGYHERQQRKLLYDEAYQCKDAADQLSFYITNEVVTGAQVIASTLVASNNHAIRGLKFSTVFIDEASQALEPASWIPILKSDRVVFAGDHQQLPPTIKSYQAAKEGLSVSLFEKAMKKQEAQVLLNEQYRMHKDIMGFSNQQFYDNQLLANETVAFQLVFNGDIPIEFIDTSGTGFFESVDPETKSSFNTEEINILQFHLNQYLDTVNSQNKEFLNIGVIAPYKAQVERLKQKISVDDSYNVALTINTIDGFQGQERDIIYITLVRSNEKGEVGFLSNERRMNVAMTRAKKKLVIIGDSSTIGNHDFYSKFLDYVQHKGEYKSAYEFMV